MSIQKTFAIALAVTTLATSTPVLAQDHAQHAAGSPSAAGLPIKITDLELGVDLSR